MVHLSPEKHPQRYCQGILISATTQVNQVLQLPGHHSGPMREHSRAQTSYLTARSPNFW